MPRTGGPAPLHQDNRRDCSGEPEHQTTAGRQTRRHKDREKNNNLNFGDPENLDKQSTASVVSAENLLAAESRATIDRDECVALLTECDSLEPEMCFVLQVFVTTDFRDP